MPQISNVLSSKSHKFLKGCFLISRCTSIFQLPSKMHLNCFWNDYIFTGSCKDNTKRSWLPTSFLQQHIVQHGNCKFGAGEMARPWRVCIALSEDSQPPVYPALGGSNVSGLQECLHLCAHIHAHIHNLK